MKRPEDEPEGVTEEDIKKIAEEEDEEAEEDESRD